MAESTTWWDQHKAADNAIGNVPLAGGVYKEFKDGYSLASDISKGNAAEAGKDVTEIASNTASFAADAVSAAIDPLNFLISKGLGFLESILTPLKDALELVTGNPDTLKDRAQKFDALAKSLKELADKVEQSAMTGAREWTGDAAPAAGQNIGETKQSIEAAAEAAGHIASLLQISSMLMQAAYDIINGIISDVIEWLVVTWVAAQAAAVFTLGGSEAAAMGASVGEVAEGAAQAGEKVEQATSIITKITNVLKKLDKILKDTKIMKDLSHSKWAENFVKDAKVEQGTGKILQSAGKGREALNKSFSDVVADSAKKNALGVVGLPTKDDLEHHDYASELNQLQQTVRDVKTGTEAAGKGYGLGAGFGKAAEYSIDPGSQSEGEGGGSEGSKQ